MMLTLLPTTAIADSTITATPSKTNFVINGQPVSVTAAYTISGTNYLQLRAIAAMLNGTTAQFDVGWDGQYAVIEPGKPYSGTVTEVKLQNTTNLRQSDTKFKMNGEIFTFADARLIGGDTNYLQLREFAQKMGSTASKFNVYWDSKAGQAVIEPGAVYTGNAPGIKNYNEEDVTWIGTTSEYKKTLAAFFDSGLRRVPVGDLAADGSLTNIKYGLVDANGAWAAQPIYDNIEAEYIYDKRSGEILRTFPNDHKPAESILVDGYVQVTRGGKMGLLDSKGKEVIPCKYDAVGLPVEGISRLIAGSADKDTLGYPKRYYLGYWSLEQGKEIVAPNKYVLPDIISATASGSPMIFSNSSFFGGDGGGYKYVSDIRIAAKFDFNGGYALVPTAKTETLSFTFHDENGLPWQKDVSYHLTYFQMVDKNGKEALSQSYPYVTNLLLGNYPQSGAYMVYEQVLTKKVWMVSDWKQNIILDKHIADGIVGAKGVIIPAQYHGGIAGSEGAWVLNLASMQISSEKNVAVTTKCGHEKIKEGDFPLVVVDFNNKDVSSSFTVNPYGLRNIDVSKVRFGEPWKDVDSDRNRWKIGVGTGIIGGTVAKNIANSQNALFDVVTGKQLTPAFLVMRSMGRGLFVDTYGNNYGPDGKIVFPRAEKVTINDRGIYGNESGVGEDLTLIVRDGNVGYINASRLARQGKGLPTTPRVKPAPPAIPVKAYFIQYPDKRTYKVGEGFNTMGLIVHWQDDTGARTVINNSKLKFFTSGTVELTPGRAFTTKGVKAVEVLYNGIKVDTFNVKVEGK